MTSFRSIGLALAVALVTVACVSGYGTNEKPKLYSNDVKVNVDVSLINFRQPRLAAPVQIVVANLDKIFVSRNRSNINAGIGGMLYLQYEFKMALNKTLQEAAPLIFGNYLDVRTLGENLPTITLEVTDFYANNVQNTNSGNGQGQYEVRMTLDATLTDADRQIIKRVSANKTVSANTTVIEYKTEDTTFMETGRFLGEVINRLLEKFFADPTIVAALEDMAGATAVASSGGVGEQPSLVIAYPKGGEEIADPKVRLIGYVKAPNLTDQVKIFVNQFPLDLSQLWEAKAIETRGLRGFPLDLNVPLQSGDNQIEIHVLDKAGYLERSVVNVRRIDIEEVETLSVAGLPGRLEDVVVQERGGSVSTDNFMAVLSDWVRDTAKSDYNKGNVMFDQGRYARANYYYHKAIKTDPMGSAWFNLGISEKALGHEGKSDDAFSRACQMQVSLACELAG